jgi:hypothetical protein
MLERQDIERIGRLAFPSVDPNLFVEDAEWGLYSAMVEYYVKTYAVTHNGGSPATTA